ncbi:nitrile hydratase accessory protein [Salinarimonas ramus]|uniref:Nitrile hydratase accessory protein n=1 Tax=Salinarimonas ramus TaxID=690164 RepID=A0A917Q4Z3_9HYPH|nr:nitrile hydratase accessory protein [Salinarimonas ramus]GGK23463.1 nitrile hydratase accessory protein [Salinarimonas ramus]
MAPEAGAERPIEERPFEEPWQASAFALAVALNARGAFTWKEWAEALSRALRTVPGADDGAGGYWTAWVAALETLIAEKGLAAPDLLAARAASWERAAAATPHGKAITLDNDPLATPAGQ